MIPMKNELERLAEVISEYNSLGNRISEITDRPATIGHTGEYIAAHVFDIELEDSATAKGFDGVFRSNNLAGRTVNVKWYTKLEFLLDINPGAVPDFFLVMTGPKSPAQSSRGTMRPWIINHVFLFNGPELMTELKARGVKIGVATSVRKHEWQAAEIYPNMRNMSYRMSDEQMAMIHAFGPDLVESWF